MKWYYYLHTDGSLIGKNPVVVDSSPDYFDSPFVKKVWQINTDERGDCWKLILESLALGANILRVEELVRKWGLNYEDSLEMLQRSKPTKLMKEGMSIFIPRFFKTTPDQYWDKIRTLK